VNVAEQILLSERVAAGRAWDSYVGPPLTVASIASQAMLGAGMRGVRVVIPRSGTLVDLHALLFSGGTIRGAVYDTAPTTRTLLWVAAATSTASSGWFKLGDPNLTVHAGQALDLAFCADNLLSYARTASTVPLALTLPMAFAGAEGGLPNLAWQTINATPPATMPEVSLTSALAVPLIIARVV
jgi:hypothetical protein